MKRYACLITWLCWLAVTCCAQSAAAFDLARCPNWLRNYERFHRANRGQPSSKYLIAAPQLRTKNGLGDRVRGVLYATRVAATSKRVLLVKWPHPDLSYFFQPSTGIDWRVAGIEAADLDLAAPNPEVDENAWGVSNKIEEYMRVRSWISNGSFAQSEKKYLVLRSNEYPNTTCGADCVEVRSTFDAICIFQYLFKPSDEVQRQADWQLAALYGDHSHLLASESSVSAAAVDAASTTAAGVEANGSWGDGTEGLSELPPDSSVTASKRDIFGLTRNSRWTKEPLPYAAVHLRLGQSSHLETKETSWRFNELSELTVLLNSITCGKKLAQSGGINTSTTPLLLLTDSNHVRKFIQQGGFTNIVTSAFDAVHLGHSEHLSMQQAYSVFVDITLLSRAKCFLMSPSGFSTTAWYLGGGKSCTLDIRHCRLQPTRL